MVLFLQIGISWLDTFLVFRAGEDWRINLVVKISILKCRFSPFFAISTAKIQTDDI